MPRNDSWGQNIPYPVLADAPDIEVAAGGIVNALTPLTVMRFKDANARAAALTGSNAPVPGMVTYLIAEDRWEARRANGSWLLMSDGPWTPFTLDNNHVPFRGAPGWRLKAGGGVEFRGDLRTTSGKLNTGAAQRCIILPAAIAPSSWQSFIVATTHAVVNGVSRMSARLDITPSGDVVYACAAGGGQGTSTSPHYMSLNGIQYNPRE